MKKDRIICLVGESGSGKTTICKKLEQLGYNIIKSYTTRKQRCENEYGHTFVSESDYVFKKYKSGIFEIWKFKKHTVEFGNVYNNIDFIAYTCFDNAHYWATTEQYKDKGTSIYVIDVAGIKELKERVKDAEMVVIYLRCDEKIRLERMWKRKCKVCNGNVAVNMYSELKNRLAHDKEVFKVVPCDYAVDANRPIEEVMEDIKALLCSI